MIIKQFMDFSYSQTVLSSIRASHYRIESSVFDKHYIEDNGSNSLRMETLFTRATVHSPADYCLVDVR